MDIFSFWTDRSKAKPYLHWKKTIDTYGKFPGESPSIHIFFLDNMKSQNALSCPGRVMPGNSNDLP